MKLAVSDASPADLLSIYLNDHLAGMRATHALAQRSLRNSTGTPLEADLAMLVDEIGEDLATMARVLDALGVRKDPVKQMAAVVGERIGRLKLNGQLRGYSPLSRVVELEGLCAGVDLSTGLWRALEHLQPSMPALDSFDVTGLVERGRRQRRSLEDHRLAAVAQALVAG